MRYPISKSLIILASLILPNLLLASSQEQRATQIAARHKLLAERNAAVVAEAAKRAEERKKLLAQRAATQAAANTHAAAFAIANSPAYRAEEAARKCRTGQLLSPIDLMHADPGTRALNDMHKRQAEEKKTRGY